MKVLIMYDQFLYFAIYYAAKKQEFIYYCYFPINSILTLPTCKTIHIKN